MANQMNQKEGKGGAMVWTIVALLGAAAIAYVVARRVARGEDPLDADALLEAADKAANNLDSILLTEATAS